MNEHFLRELKDTEPIEDNSYTIENTSSSITMEEFLNLKHKFLDYPQIGKNNSTKRGNNPKDIKARRKKNKNKKTHRK